MNNPVNTVQRMTLVSAIASNGRLPIPDLMKKSMGLRPDGLVILDFENGRLTVTAYQEPSEQPSSTKTPIVEEPKNNE